MTRLKKYFTFFLILTIPCFLPKQLPGDLNVSFSDRIKKNVIFQNLSFVIKKYQTCTSAMFQRLNILFCCIKIHLLSVISSIIKYFFQKKINPFKVTVNVEFRQVMKITLREFDSLTAFTRCEVNTKVKTKVKTKNLIIQLLHLLV